MGNNKKKILVIRLGAIGDVVHTTIIAKAIKEKYPEYKVHYLTQSDVAPVLINHPYIDKVIIWEKKYRKSFRYVTDIIKGLFSERYDVIFSLTNSIRNFYLSLLAFPKKIVTVKKHKGLWVEAYFNSAKKAFPELEIPKSLSLGTDNKDLETVSKLLSDHPKPHVMIIPGGGTDKNRQGRIWNINKWAELSDSITKRYGGTVFVVGSKSERQYHEVLARENTVITSGNYSLSESSALLSKSDLVISGDTGTLHIASAHGVPSIAILGSTSPDKIKPYGDNGFYIEPSFHCKYCWEKKCKHLKNNEKYTPCIESITSETVLNKIISENLL